jgi:hypothetical protein
MSPVSGRCARAAAMRDVNPLDLVETIGEGALVLEPDLTIPLCEPLLLRHIRSRFRSGGRAEGL